MTSRRCPTFSQLCHERDGLIDQWLRHATPIEHRSLGRYLSTGVEGDAIPVTIRILQEAIQEALA